MRVIAAAVLLLVSMTSTAATLEFTIQPTVKDEAGNNLPASGPGSLTSHRVEYGTCSGSSLGTVTVTMPAVQGRFLNVPIGLYCLRAFPSNVYGEGAAYPVSSIGPVPSGAGQIIVIRASSP